MGTSRSSTHSYCLTCSSALLDEHGIRLNVLGRKELLPENVQAAIRKAEEMTRNNDRYI